MMAWKPGNAVISNCLDMIVDASHGDLVRVGQRRRSGPAGSPGRRPLRHSGCQPSAWPGHDSVSQGQLEFTL